MSYYTRLGFADAQEQAVAKVERAFKKANTNIGGATTIGKSPQTVIMDVYHHDSAIYIDSDGVIRMRHGEVSDMDKLVANIVAVKERTYHA